MTRSATSPTIPVACFAPPLSDETLARYQALVAALGPDQAELKDVLSGLMKCIQVWWELPESRRKPTLWKLYHVERQAEMEVPETPLEHAHVTALWDVTPWMRELDTLSTPLADGPFDTLPPGELRELAFHLLWHAKELTLDREPMTRDKVPLH